MKFKERSLIEFCNHVNIDLSNVQYDLFAIKKQIKLEFKAADVGIIMIEGNQYDYNFVSQALENPNLAVEIEYEMTISKVAWLNDVINKNTVDFSEITFVSQNHKSFKNNKFVIPVQYDSPEFREYLSPKLAIAFNIISRRLLVEDLFFKQIIVNNLLEFIQQKDYEVAFQYISLMMADALKIIRNTNKENYKQKGNSIERWSINSAGNFINALPDYFAGVKNSFGIAMTNLLANMQSMDHLLVFQLSRQLLKVEGLSPELDKIIKGNHKIFEENKNGVKKVELQENMPAWTIYVIMFVIVKFIALMLI